MSIRSDSCLCCGAHAKLGGCVIGRYACDCEPALSGKWCKFCHYCQKHCKCQLTDEQKSLKKGDQVVIGSQLDSRHDLMYRGYFGEIVDICGEFALVDSDKVGLMQSVSFQTWLPIRSLTRTA